MTPGKTSSFAGIIESLCGMSGVLVLPFFGILNVNISVIK